MKTLLLLRHAKADNAAPGSSDIDRSLNERGKKEAQAIGTFIRKAQRHETCVTISVPRSGPATLAIAHALLAAPSALPRLLGG